MKTTSAKLATKPLAKALKSALSPMQETPLPVARNLGEEPLSKREDDWISDQKTTEQYRRLAKMGDDIAQFNLGVSYLGGKGIVQSYEKAIQWFQKAAEQGHATAQFNLGIAYRDGKGVPKDDKEAFEWFSKAAKQGLVEAQNALGVAYSDGKGTSQNHGEAIKWFSEAAKQRSSIAKFNLAQDYRENNNDEQALKLLGEVLASKNSIEETNLFMIPFDPDASLVWVTREVIRSIKLKAANRALENLLSMVAHKLGGPLDSLEYNVTHQNDPQQALRFIKVLQGFREIFGVVSTNATQLRQRMRQDKQGEGTLLAVLQQSLEFSFSQLLTPEGFGKISQHYFAYAKQHHLFTSERDLWEHDYYNTPLLQLQERLQEEWQASFHAIAAAGDLDSLLKWIEEHFFRLDWHGFQDKQIHFKKYGITESILTIIFTEILSNAIKYYEISGSQPVLLHWQCDSSGGKLICKNPTSLLECYDKGSMKGHNFLKLLATNLNGEFTTTLRHDHYTATLIIPTELLLIEEIS